MFAHRVVPFLPYPRRGPARYRRAAASYGAVAAAIGDWGDRRPTPPIHLRDAIEILLNHLWVILGEGRQAAPEPRSVIALVKDPDARCVYCGETVAQERRNQKFKEAWIAGGVLVVGACEHSYYNSDEWNWLVMGGARSRIVTSGRVSDIAADLARQEFELKNRIFANGGVRQRRLGYGLVLDRDPKPVRC